MPSDERKDEAVRYCQGCEYRVQGKTACAEPGCPHFPLATQPEPVAWQVRTGIERPTGEWETHNYAEVFNDRVARLTALGMCVEHRALYTTPPAPEVTEAMVEALEAKKYQPPLASDQSIWNAAMNTAIEVVKSTAALRGGAKG